jgi:hypothetical protein
MFISQVIYELGEPWWNDMNRGKLLIRPPDLSGNLVAKQEEQAKEIMTFAF